MNTGQEKTMLRGAICACIMPMALGAYGLTLMIQNLAVFQQGQSFSDSPYFFTLPLALCFFFGTPLAALTACIRMSNFQNLDHFALWKRAARLGLQSASAVHFWSALAYTLTALMFFFPDGGNLEGAVIQWIGILIFSGILNALLWALITLPCALFCATFFWLTVKSSNALSI